MAGEKTVYIKVGAKVDGAVAGLRKVQGSLNDLTKSDLKKPQAAFDGLSNKAALAGGVVALGVGKAVASFADFDQAMSGVAANSGATGSELDALRDKAMKLGADTQFSATEAAQGINELAKAGVSSQEILNGGLKGALDLAAAGQIGVAQAAETTASALNQFEQDGSQATHVADLLSNAANAAQGGVGDMGLALNQAGVAAHAAGLSLDETTTLLALFAKAGMTGSDAGTSLKTMMQRLSAPTEKAAATLKELGVSAYDAQGNFVGAQSLLQQLAEGTKTYSTEAKMAAFNTIFGSDAIRAASIATAAGADGYQKMATQVTKAGGAAANAAKLTDNLKGDIERLGGSIDTLFIQTGSSVNGGLRTLVQGFGSVVDVVGNLPGPLVLATTGLAGLALTLPKGISVFREFNKSLDTMGVSVGKVSDKAPKLGLALRGLQGVVAGLAIASTIGAISNSLTDLAAIEFDPQSIKDGTVTLDAFNKKMGETTDLGLPIATTISDFGQVLEATFNAGKGQEIDSFFAKINSNLGFENTSDIAVASQRFAEMDNVLAALVAGGKGDAAQKLFEQITTAAAVQGITVDQLKSKLPGYAQALVDAGNASSDAAPKLGDTSDAVKDIEKQADDAKKALDKLTETLQGFGSPLAAQRAAQRDYADAINGAKDAIKKQREELIKQREEEVAGAKPSQAALAALEKAQLRVAQAQEKVNAAGGKGKASQSSLDAIARATQRVAQAQEKLNSVQAKGTAAQKLSARQALDRANLSLSQARSKPATAGGGGKGSTAAQQELARATLEMQQAQEKVNQSQGKAKDLTDAQRAAIEKWADAQLKATNLLDLNTDAGRTNQAALDGIRDKTLKAATATFELTHSADLAAKKVAEGRKAFVDQAVALGLSSAQANALADNMGLVPKEVKSTIELSGVPTANTQLDGVTGKLTTLDKTTSKPEIKPFLNTGDVGVVEARLDKFDRQHPKPEVKPFVNTANADAVDARIDQLARQRTALITIDAGLSDAAAGLLGGISGIGKLTATAATPKTKRATGGAIYGPGSGTSDSIPAMLSNGEHVLTAAEVAAAGGHGAIYALRKAILTGGVQYRAQGGPALAHAYRAAPVYAGSSRGPSAAEIGAAVAAQMPPQVSVYSGQDARHAARTAIRDWEWGQTQ